MIEPVLREAARSTICLIAMFVIASSSCAKKPTTVDELEGVRVPRELVYEEKKLVLNGMGVRQVTAFKAYVAALWVEHPSTNPEEILKRDEGRRVELHILSDLTHKQVREAFERAMTSAAGTTWTSVAYRIAPLLDALRDLKKGETITISYTPVSGLNVDGGLTHSVTLSSKESADLVFSAWLGPRPVDESVKLGLLGLTPKK